VVAIKTAIGERVVDLFDVVRQVGCLLEDRTLLGTAGQDHAEIVERPFGWQHAAGRGLQALRRLQSADRGRSQRQPREGDHKQVGGMQREAGDQGLTYPPSYSIGAGIPRCPR